MKHEVKLKPFSVPNYVIQVTSAIPRQKKWSEAPVYHLSELSEETLTAMCDEFRDGVFAKAAQGDPARQARSTSDE